MDKVLISNKISHEAHNVFEQMCDELGPPKNRVIEAAFEAFNALPREIQYRLRSLNPAEREPCFKLLAELSLTEETQQHETKPAITECIDTVKDFANRYKIPDKEQRLLMASLRKALEPEPPKQTKKRKQG